MVSWRSSRASSGKRRMSDEPGCNRATRVSCKSVRSKSRRAFDRNLVRRYSP